MSKILYLIVLCLVPIPLYPKEEIIQLKQGNLALSSSQQAGPLFAFGQNIIDKHDRQLFAYADITKGMGKNFVQMVPSFLYGITDNTSFFCSLPVTRQRLDGDFSSGFKDLLVQFEYEFYTHKERTLIDEATVVGSVILPTGSGSKNPNTGFGAPAFFLGATLSRTEIDWYFFASPGVVITTTNNERRYGNQYLLQCGVGRNIPTSPDTILTGMVELNGIFVNDTKINGLVVIDSSLISAGVYLCPSIWFSSKKIIVQGGIAIPLFQQVTDHQIKNDYVLAVNFGVKF